MLVTAEQLETGIAELEGWGLDRATISWIEQRYGYVWIAQLRYIDPEEFLSCNRLGPERLQHLQKALAAFLAGEDPRTPPPM